MENKNVSTEQTEDVQDTRSQLNKVTPLSKYLAMGLFVALPFLGGWIGYTYAPEKIVQVDRIIEVEKITEVVTGDILLEEDELYPIRLTTKQLASQYIIGANHHDWTIISTTSDESGYSRTVEFESESNFLTGTLSIQYDWQQSGSYYLQFQPDTALPDIPVNGTDGVMLSMRPLYISFESGSDEENLFKLCESNCFLPKDASFEDKETFYKEFRVKILPTELRRTYFVLGRGMPDRLTISDIQASN
jgi:hypothetical protein